MKIKYYYNCNKQNTWPHGKLCNKWQPHTSAFLSQDWLRMGTKAPQTAVQGTWRDSSNKQADKEKSSRGQPQVILALLAKNQKLQQRRSFQKILLSCRAKRIDWTCIKTAGNSEGQQKGLLTQSSHHRLLQDLQKYQSSRGRSQGHASDFATSDGLRKQRSFGPDHVYVMQWSSKHYWKYTGVDRQRDNSLRTFTFSLRSITRIWIEVSRIDIEKRECFAQRHRRELNDSPNVWEHFRRL